VAIAYHPTRKGLLLFGGYDWGTDTVLSDTWLLRQDEWTELTPSQAPSVRWGSGLCSTDDGVLLFGGFHSDRYLGDTWQLQ
jgi:hypothetical protein